VRVSVIVVAHNARELVRACLASIPTDSELLVVDNASIDGCAEMIAAEFPRANLIRNPINVGFARANNQALRKAKGELILLLNSDAELRADCLASLETAFAAHPELGIAGPRLLNTDGTWQPSWGKFPTPATEFLFQSYLYKIWPTCFPYGRRVSIYFHRAYGAFRWVEWVTGAALILRRQVYDAIGGLPENTFMYGEDLEYCALARAAGFGVAYVPTASVCHHLQASSRRDYARWIENYTQATLAYYSLHGMPAERSAVARWIIAGSILRRTLWLLAGWMSPGLRQEAQHRARGYRKAESLAKTVLQAL
jgi:GT2 family glycosyltransferase